MGKGLTPWVDITCGRCGSLAAGSGWWHNGIIGKLRDNTKDWIDEDMYGYLCPECQKELQEEQNDNNKIS